MQESNDNLAAPVTSRSTVGAPRNGLFVVGLIAAVAAAAIATVIVPQFRSLFAGFGADLPFATHLAVHYYLALWVFPLIVIAIRVTWPDPQARSLVACIVGVGGLGVITTILTVVLYLPILKLGQPV